MVLGNIQFEGPKATERADHIYEERHCNRVNQQPDIRMRTDRHIHYESVNDRAYVDEELHHDQQLAVGLPVFHSPARNDLCFVPPGNNGRRHAEQGEHDQYDAGNHF